MSRLLRWATITLVLVALATIGLYLWPIGKQPSGLEALLSQADKERGLALLHQGGCISCHSDKAQLAGGKPIETPFGTFYPPNISRHPQAGIGNWTIGDFARATRQGVSPTGKPYYPVFPYSSYRFLFDKDIVDMFAALADIPHQGASSSSHQIDFPFSFRPSLKIWRGLFYSSQPNSISTSDNPAYQRGAYLAESLLHCGECHTPRNSLGIPKADQQYLGADGLPEDASAPDITATSLQNNGWSKLDLSYYLKSGIDYEGDVAGSLMAEFIEEATSKLSKEDRDALATYLLAN